MFYFCFNVFGKFNIYQFQTKLQKDEKKKALIIFLQTWWDHGEITDQRGHCPRHFSYTKDVHQPLRELQHRKDWTFQLQFSSENIKTKEILSRKEILVQFIKVMFGKLHEQPFWAGVVIKTSHLLLTFSSAVNILIYYFKVIEILWKNVVMESRRSSSPHHHYWKTIHSRVFQDFKFRAILRSFFSLDILYKSRHGGQGREELKLTLAENEKTTVL